MSSQDLGSAGADLLKLQVLPIQSSRRACAIIGVLHALKRWSHHRTFDVAPKGSCSLCESHRPYKRRSIGGTSTLHPRVMSGTVRCRMDRRFTRQASVLRDHTWAATLGGSAGGRRIVSSTVVISVRRKCDGCFDGAVQSCLISGYLGAVLPRC